MSASTKAKEVTDRLFNEEITNVRTTINDDSNLSPDVKRRLLHNKDGNLKDGRNKKGIIKSYREQLKTVFEKLEKEKEGGRLRKKQKKRKIRGAALVRFARKQEVDEFQLPNTKLRIDGGNLRNNNILKLKYKCNNNVHPNMKIQRISVRYFV